MKPECSTYTRLNSILRVRRILITSYRFLETPSTKAEKVDTVAASAYANLFVMATALDTVRIGVEPWLIIR